jgi:hypothetical protein
MSAAIVIAEHAPPEWDSRTVDPPGGHVLQSTAWAEHWRAAGRRPLFVTTGDAGLLAIVRPWPLIPGGAAYVSRGPIPTADGTVIGQRLVAATEALAGRGIDVVAADPEVPAADEAYALALRDAGFHQIEELQPGRHRLTLPLAGIDVATALARATKSTRQRVRKAEGTSVVVRFDGPDREAAGEGFAKPTEAPLVALTRFYGWLAQTGVRLGFHLGPIAHNVGWWLRALEAGHLVYLECRERETGQPLGGLVLYRHGRRLSTAHSADLADARRAHPGTMHLLRWRAVELAILEGRDELDMGSVDVAGARREPTPGEPTYGLYEHKRSFGAEWLSLQGAHERVIRPGRYLAGRVLQRASRLVSR